jgi:aryl-alcohol dehydrogenase-like predicted oxidoreductase
MEYRVLGKTGLRVSEIGFGAGFTAALLAVEGDRDEQREAVARALELGINYFDTAPVYGRGHSESRLGEILRELGVRPIIATKAMVRHEDLNDTRGTIVRSVEGSLDRLGIDAIDVIQLHNPVSVNRIPEDHDSLEVDEVLRPGGVLDTFEDLQRQGKVRFLGFTGMGHPPAINQLIDSGRFQVMQAYYNLLNPSAGMAVPAGFRLIDWGQIIDHAAANEVGVVIIRVLAAGALGGKEERQPPPGSWAHTNWLEVQSDRLRAQGLQFLVREGQTLAQAAIRFALIKREVSTVLVGFSTRADVEEAAACSPTQGLSDEEMAQLWRLYTFN